MSTAALLPLLVLVGLVVGFAAGLLGVGGGILMVPVLVLVAGMSQHEAEATSLLVVVPTAIVATVVLQRRRVGDLGASMRLGVFGIAGGVAGALVALMLTGCVLSVIFAVFLAFVGVRMIRDALASSHA